MSADSISAISAANIIIRLTFQRNSHLPRELIFEYHLKTAKHLAAIIQIEYNKFTIGAQLTSPTFDNATNGSKSAMSKHKLAICY